MADIPIANERVDELGDKLERQHDIGGVVYGVGRDEVRDQAQEEFS